MFKQNAQHERKRVKTLIMVMFSGGIMDNFRSLLSRPMCSAPGVLCFPQFCTVIAERLNDIPKYA